MSESSCKCVRPFLLLLPAAPFRGHKIGSSDSIPPYPCYTPRSLQPSACFPALHPWIFSVVFLLPGSSIFNTLCPIYRQSALCRCLLKLWYFSHKDGDFYPPLLAKPWCLCDPAAASVHAKLDTMTLVRPLASPWSVGHPLLPASASLWVCHRCFCSS